MDAQRQPQERPSGFTCKKWTIVTLTLISLILIIVGLVLSIQLIDTLTTGDFSSGTTQDGLDAAKSTAKGILIGVGVVSILLELMGLFGALKEHYCMLMTYGCLTIVLAIISIASALGMKTSGSIWGSFVLYLLIGGLSISLARDVKFMRNSAFQTTVVVTNPYQVNQMGGQTWIPPQGQPAYVPQQTQPAWTYSENQQVNHDQSQMEQNIAAQNKTAPAPGWNNI